MNVRSNDFFRERGFDKKVQYQISLSTSRNPDFVVRHPNETKEKNPANWKAEIKTRVKKEEDGRQKMLAVRLEKRTGSRRV